MDIILDRDMQSAINAFAKEKNITQEAFIKEVLQEYIEEKLDYKKGELAYQEYLQDRQTKSAKELYKEMGL